MAYQTFRKIRLFFTPVLILGGIFLGTALLYGYDVKQMYIDFLQERYDTVIQQGEGLLAYAGKPPALDDLYYLLGMSYLKKGNYLRAADIFGLIVTEIPHSQLKNEAMLALADTYFLAGNYDEASQTYNRLLAQLRQETLRPALYYRLALLAKYHPACKQHEYYLQKLKRQFPQAVELQLNQDPFINLSPQTVVKTPLEQTFYSLQIGAFSKERNAQRLLNELRQKGFSAYIVKFRQPNLGVIYRVRAGNFSSLQDALEYEKKLKKIGYAAKVCTPTTP